MARDVIISARAEPNNAVLRRPAVHVSFAWPGGAYIQVMTLPDAEVAYDAIGAAIGALKLGASYSAGTDPRNVERLYRAKLAVRLGLPPHDVRTVFDLTAPAYERLVAEVLK